jgi:hypothetical protein
LPSFKCWTSSYNSLNFVILELEFIFSALYFVNVMLGYIIILLDRIIIEPVSSEMELDFFKNRTGNFSSLDLELEHERDFCYVAPALEMMKFSAFILTVLMLNKLMNPNF